MYEHRKTTKYKDTIYVNTSTIKNMKNSFMRYIRIQSASFRSKKFVYSDSRDSHNSMTDVVTQVCWVLYKSICLYNLFIDYSNHL